VIGAAFWFRKGRAHQRLAGMLSDFAAMSGCVPWVWRSAPETRGARGKQRPADRAAGSPPCRIPAAVRRPLERMTSQSEPKTDEEHATFRRRACWCHFSYLLSTDRDPFDARFQARFRRADMGSILSRLAVAVASFGVVLAGCSGAERAGSSYTQCVNHPAGTTAGGTAITATVDALLPQDAQVRCADSTSFVLDGNEVKLVYVAYGMLRDCPAGCFTSHICAIYDTNGALPYSAAWYSPGEKPVLPTDCPDTGDTRQCTTATPGSQHPITQTPAFVGFRDEQVQSQGDWRFCFF
jgi:hypothetical protein